MFEQLVTFYFTWNLFENVFLKTPNTFSRSQKAKSQQTYTSRKTIPSSRVIFINLNTSSHRKRGEEEEEVDGDADDAHNSLGDCRTPLGFWRSKFLLEFFFTRLSSSSVSPWVGDVKYTHTYKYKYIYCHEQAATRVDVFYSRERNA